MADCDGVGEGSGAADTRPLKPGERIIPPSRRPDGSMRKEIRIRAGYTPQEEVARYESKGTLFLKGKPAVPPGYDPVTDAPGKPKSKSSLRNEKRKQKRQEHRDATESATSDGSASSVSELAARTLTEARLITTPMSLSSSSSSPSLTELQCAVGAAYTEHFPTVAAGARPSTSMPQAILRAGSAGSKTGSASAAAVAVAGKQEGVVGETSEREKRVRALRKKIRQTEQLTTDSGTSLTAEQKDKISKLVLWKSEVDALEAQLSSLRMQCGGGGGKEQARV